MSSSKVVSFPSPLRCGLLISGGGRTALNLLDVAAEGNLAAEFPLVIADRKCPGLELLAARGVPVELISRREYPSTELHSQAVFDRLREVGVDVALLAGYLSRVEIPADFEYRVINIHPSLIPAFAGPGMYGERVHQAVLDRGCKITGCTVHFCDNEFDHGPIILQSQVPVLDDDTPGRLAARVFNTECALFPEALRQLQSKQVCIEGSRVRLRTVADQQ
jgi:formyltetrahydrofolate-dependent phosphoribosylglycinamide formyltransferase